MCMSTHRHSYLSQALTYQHLDLPKDGLLKSIVSYYNNHFQRTDFYIHIKSDWGNTDREFLKSARSHGKFRLAFQLDFGVFQLLGRPQAMSCSGYHTEVDVQCHRQHHHSTLPRAASASATLSRHSKTSMSC